ncbi:Maf family protein [Paracoccaceae bacterium]|nr:Maf family protein [Paracoccaceae bacterium]
MSMQLVLASSSLARSRVLNNAGVVHEILSPQIDEDSVKVAMLADGYSHRDIADKIADMKARKVSLQRAESYVLGCDQVLSFAGSLYSKPETKFNLETQLRDMSGKTHQLISAAVIYKDMQPIWRHVGVATLSMDSLSGSVIEKYVEKNWDTVKFCVGGYEIERRGVQLFNEIQGDYFCILGLPLLEIINFLKVRGVLES